MKNNPDYKLTPLGYIPVDWEVIHFGELFEFKNGVNAGIEFYGKGYKFINLLEVLNYSIITETVIKGSIQLTEEQFFQNQVLHGDILFNRTSEVANEIGLSSVYLDDKPVVFGGFVIRGRPKSCAIDDFFKAYCFYVSYVRKQIIGYGQGAIRTNIGQSDLEKVQFILPPLQEQKNIARLLLLWDNAVEKTEQLLKLKEDYKQALMQQLLTGKKRLKGFSGDWKEVKLGEIGYVPQKKPIIKIGNLKLLTVRLYNKGVDFNLEKKPIIKSTGRPYYIRYENEILIGRQNIHNGGIGLVKKDFSGNICSNAITSYIVDQNLANHLFVLNYLSFPKIYKSFENLMGGTGQKELSEHVFLGLIIKIPSFIEQTAIVEVLEKADKEIEIIKKEIEALKEQKKGLMQILLTGKKRLK